MTILRGHIAMMQDVTGPAGVAAAGLEAGPGRPRLGGAAAHQVNIVDLQTRVVGEPDPVYAMHFELRVPPAAPPRSRPTPPAVSWPCASRQSRLPTRTPW
jgi:hypothetical protein